MDLPTGTNKAGPALAPRQAPGGNEPADTQRGEHFERLLCDKTSAFAEAAEADDDTSMLSDPDSTDAAAAAQLRPMAPPALQASTGQRPVATANPPRDLPAPAGGARMHDTAAPAGSTLLASAPAVWEVSVQDSRGVAITVRASRPAGLQPAGEPAPWTLSITAPALEAAALQRHAPRLDERLKARALTLTHVRIEGDEDASH